MWAIKLLIFDKLGYTWFNIIDIILSIWEYFFAFYICWSSILKTFIYFPFENVRSSGSDVLPFLNDSIILVTTCWNFYPFLRGFLFANSLKNRFSALVLFEIFILQNSITVSLLLSNFYSIFFVHFFKIFLYDLLINLRILIYISWSGSCSF
jgi:hypothetical protein